MALVLTLRGTQDVYIGDVQVVLHRILEDATAVLRVGTQFITINSHNWVKLVEAPKCFARVTSHQRNSIRDIRVQFEAPSVKVLRGSTYRNKETT